MLLSNVDDILNDFHTLGRPCFTRKKLAKLRRCASQLSIRLNNLRPKIFLYFHAELDHSKIFLTVLFKKLYPAFNFYWFCVSYLWLKTALVWVCVIDHQPGPLSHLTKMAVGVVEVPGNQDNHHI